MNNKNVHHCDRCGAEVHGDEYMVFDDEILCPSCLNCETLLCEHCGERIRRDDNAETLLGIANSGDEKIYIKCDSSLDDGMEIVTISSRKSSKYHEELCVRVCAGLDRAAVP